MTKEEIKLKKSEYDKERRRRLKYSKEDKERDLQIRLKELDRLFNYFKTEVDVDLLSLRKTDFVVKYRSLFNILAMKKLKLRKCQITKFYAEKGRRFSSSDLRHSEKMFKIYKVNYPEVKELYLELYNKRVNRRKAVIKIDNRELKPIQKLVDNLTPQQEDELIELITLRKKSWEWKNKDLVKIYTSVE